MRPVVLKIDCTLESLGEIFKNPHKPIKSETLKGLSIFLNVGGSIVQPSLRTIVLENEYTLPI